MRLIAFTYLLIYSSFHILLSFYEITYPDKFINKVLSKFTNSTLIKLSSVFTTFTFLAIFILIKKGFLQKNFFILLIAYFNLFSAIIYLFFHQKTKETINTIIKQNNLSYKTTNKFLEEKNSNDNEIDELIQKNFIKTALTFDSILRLSMNLYLFLKLCF